MPGRAHRRARGTGASGAPSELQAMDGGETWRGADERPRDATSYFSSFQSLKNPYVTPMTGIRKKNHQATAP